MAVKALQSQTTERSVWSILRGGYMKLNGQTNGVMNGSGKLGDSHYPIILASIDLSMLSSLENFITLFTSHFAYLVNAGWILCPLNRHARSSYKRPQVWHHRALYQELQEYTGRVSFQFALPWQAGFEHKSSVFAHPPLEISNKPLFIFPRCFIERCRSLWMHRAFYPVASIYRYSRNPFPLLGQCRVLSCCVSHKLE